MAHDHSTKFKTFIIILPKHLKLSKKKLNNNFLTILFISIDNILLTYKLINIILIQIMIILQLY